MSPHVLAELLEQRRVVLEALPGVIGTAVGASAGGAGSDEAIHLYVTRDVDVGHVRSEANRLLEGAPVELIEMEMPQAQPD